MWKSLYAKIKRKNRNGQLVLLLVFLVSLCAGFILAYVPIHLHKQAAQAQHALLESIEQGDGSIALTPELAALELDFYEGGAAAGADSVIVSEATSIDGIGILSLDRIGMRLPVTDGIGDAQLKVSAGHVPQTAAIGTTGNAVILGHRSHQYGELFNRLGEVRKGDVIKYQFISGDTLQFIVEETAVTTPDDPAAVQQPADRVQITLYTCEPVRTATHRLYIRATLIEEGGTLK